MTETRRMIDCARLFVSIVVCTLAVSGAELSAPVRRVAFADAVPGAVAPKWHEGYLISWRPSTSYSDSGQNIAIYDRDGRILRSARLWFPDASLVWIRDLAGQDGRVVAVGQAMTETGGMAGFLAFMPVNGDTARIVQTSPFECQAVAVGPDQSVWVLGFQVGEERKVRNAPDHAMLRHYDQNGSQIGEALPWSSFQCGLHPVAVSPAGRAALTASKDRIGVLLPECHEWLELDLSGKITGRWGWRDLPSTNDSRISSVTMTPSNEVFARIGTGLYRLSRQQGTWEPLDLHAVSDSGAMFSWLAGNDGESLVYTSARQLIWAQPGK